MSDEVRTIENADLDPETVRRVKDLLAKVPDEHRTAFLEFVCEGKLSDDFRVVIDNDPAIRAAIDEALGMLSEGMDKLYEAFGGSDRSTADSWWRRTVNSIAFWR